ncbi:MAG TPA: ABC transporter permease [Draconibacterium sp.]|nr:ABC transporter permease [Draconibacterium sp.]
MKTLMFLLEKEFRQIFRDKTILRMILVVPIIQLLIIPLAADYEIKNINITITDHDRSAYSQKLTSQILASGYFVLTDYNNSFETGFRQMESDETDVILEIPKDFEKNLLNGQSEKLFVALNAINGTKASVGGAYLGRIIGEYNQNIIMEIMPSARIPNVPTIEITSSNWFNRFLNYPNFMVPGILVILVTMVGAFMCSLNIVKEKEVGTIEQINVTPIRKHHFILSKLIPFWLIGMFVFSVGLFVISRLVYGIVPAGSIPLLYSYLAIFLVAVLGVGLTISTYSNTQQQAMSLAFFFMMIFILMGGLFTSIDSMPEWAKWIARFNPVTYFIEVMRMIVMKGSDFRDIKYHFVIMFGFAAFFNAWAIINYKKTS